MPLEKVYDCMNSWGLKQPFVTIPSKDPAILRIYRVTSMPILIHPRPRGEAMSEGAQGGSCDDIVFGGK